MATLFTRIIAGELPGRFIWKDPHCVAFLTIEPLAPGHVLVVPRDEIDHWLDLTPELNAHLFEVARQIGAALQETFEPTKVGLIVAGLEVNHVHLHVVPIRALGELNFANADRNASADDLDAAAERLRHCLRSHGHEHVSD
ncbi:MAG: diadenosine tetraphosphate hydrolase [Planctomycetota bacterium]|nr:MAG: diadenosine tetraphosphate hydrolase [Planctomycetota bacterium]